MMYLLWTSEHDEMFQSDFVWEWKNKEMNEEIRVIQNHKLPKNMKYGVK